MTDGSPLFSRTELAGGLPARRATAVLFAIENRTARLVVRARRALERYVSERAAVREEQAFLAALAEGRDPPLRPSIRDLERQAPAWADLVAPDPALRAAIAHRLAERHRFRRGDVPRLRLALGLDDPAVLETYQRLFAQALATIYRDRLPLADRLGWIRSRLGGRLEDLPPFWWAFALTLTETVGAGVLALPIALAGVGILPAIGLLVGFGLVNILTVAALVESITRDGAIRFGSSYLGRLVEDFLGRPGRLLLSVALFAVGVVSLPAYVIGVGSALGGATGLSPLIWIALLAAATLIVLRRGSLDATVATAIVIGATNVALLLAIAAIALAHADPTRIAAVAASSHVSTAGLVFGVLLGAYFGHTAAATASKVVLARDPSGRSLLRGSVAAMASAIGLYVLVVVGILGAVPAAALQGFGGTALEPLIGVTGPVVGVLGGVFVVLAMGLATIISSLALYNQTLETLLERPSIERRLHDRPTLSWLAAAGPIAVVFVATTVLFQDGGVTFAGPMALLGTIGTPLVAGVFPMLLVLAARRRGEFSAPAAIRGLGHPLVVATVVVIFISGALVQGWLVARDPATEVATSIVAVLIGLVVVQAFRSGAFRRRAVLEVVDEGRSRRLRLSLVVAGRPVPLAGISSGSAGAAGVALPALGELLIWAHHVTDEGDTVPFQLGVTATTEAASRDLGVTGGDGRLTTFLGGIPTTIGLRLPTSAVAPRRETAMGSSALPPVLAGSGSRDARP